MGKTKWEGYSKVSNETGEVIGCGAIPIQEPDFVKLYVTNVLMATRGLELKAGWEVFICMCKYATFINGEEIPVCFIGEYEIKTFICPQTGLNRSRVYALIKQLCEEDIIRKIGNCRYQINPYYVAKGTWKDISKIQVQWDIEKKEFEIKTIRKEARNAYDQSNSDSEG